MIDLTQKRPTRHSIFDNLRQRQNANIRAPLNQIRNTQAQFMLRQSLFQLQSVLTVLERVDSYNNLQAEIVAKLNLQLESFNRFKDSPFNEQEILNELIQYSKIIQEDQQSINRYKMIKDACPSNSQNIGIKMNKKVQDVRYRLNDIMIQIKLKRNSLLQHSIEFENERQTCDVTQQARSLSGYIDVNQTLINQSMIFILKDTWKNHERNIEILLQHKSIYLRLESVFDSMKIMKDSQKSMSKMIDAINLHFTDLTAKINDPQELLKDKNQFFQSTQKNHHNLVNNRKLFDKNISNSYIRDYEKELNQYVKRCIQFDKTYEEYKANSKVFDVIYEYKEKMKQRLNKKNKTKQDIEQLKSIYRGLTDLNTNQQISQHKIYVLNLHVDNLKKLGIQVEKPEVVDNYLLTVKIKQFHVIIDGGLKYMAINEKQLIIFKSEVKQIKVVSPEGDLRNLCEKYLHQINISLKLIEIYNDIKENEYQLINQNLFYIANRMHQVTLNQKIKRMCAQYFSIMDNFEMIPSLQKLFYKYIRDLFILIEIETQYGSLKNNYYKRKQQTFENEVNFLKANEIQAIFPILKSIRHLSEVDSDLKRYLQQNVLKIYFQFVMEVQNINNPISKLRQKKTIEKNPQFFNTFQSLYYCQTLREEDFLDSKDILPLLQKIIQSVSAIWTKLSVKEKMTQLLKFYFLSLILKSNLLQKYSNYLFCLSSLRYLMEYLMIDTEIRMIAPIQNKLTYSDSLFFLLTKLQYKKLHLKYNPNESNATTSSIRRLVLELESTSPFKVTLKNPIQQLISQLKIVQSHNELQQLAGFNNLLPLAKKSLLYQYVENILTYKPCSGLQAEILVTKNSKEYEVNIRKLNTEGLELYKIYEKWANNIINKFNKQMVEFRQYRYPHQGTILTAL